MSEDEDEPPRTRAMMAYNRWAGSYGRVYRPMQVVRTEDELKEGFRRICAKHGLVAPDHLDSVTLTGIGIVELSQLFADSTDA